MPMHIHNDDWSGEDARESVWVAVSDQYLSRMRWAKERRGGEVFIGGTK
jgi:hypothetical protein